MKGKGYFIRIAQVICLVRIAEQFSERFVHPPHIPGVPPASALITSQMCGRMRRQRKGQKNCQEQKQGRNKNNFPGFRHNNILRLIFDFLLKGVENGTIILHGYTVNSSDHYMLCFDKQ